jgi:hypothetical protein
MSHPVVQSAKNQTASWAIWFWRRTEEDPEESVSPAELWSLDRSGERGHLLPEREVFERDGPVSAAD